MTEDERLRMLLRSSLPPAAASPPSRDLWPLIATRRRAPVSWPWLDISVATIVTVVLLMFPSWLWFLAYHL